MSEGIYRLASFVEMDTACRIDTADIWPSVYFSAELWTRKLLMGLDRVREVEYVMRNKDKMSQVADEGGLENY